MVGTESRYIHKYIYIYIDMERRGSRPYRRGSRKQTKAEEQAERLAELNRRDASRGTGTETVTKDRETLGP